MRGSLFLARLRYIMAYRPTRPTCVRSPEAGTSPVGDKIIMRKLMAAILLLLSIAARGLDAEDPSRAYQKPNFSQLESQARDAVDWNTWLKGLGSDVSIRVNSNNREDSLRGVSVSMERETKSGGHGLLGLTWRHREVANLELIHLSDRLYVVAHVSGTVSSKAPLGNWHVKKEGPLPAFYSGPKVGTLVDNVSVSQRVESTTERD